MPNIRLSIVKKNPAVYILDTQPRILDPPVDITGYDIPRCRFIVQGIHATKVVMATQEETVVTESSPSSDPHITIGLAVSSSKSSKYAVRWALKNFGTRERTRFMLIHVRQKVTLVPTPSK
jgi:hypothetical protein